MSRKPPAPPTHISKRPKHHSPQVPSCTKCKCQEKYGPIEINKPVPPPIKIVTESGKTVGILKDSKIIRKNSCQECKFYANNLNDYLAGMMYQPTIHYCNHPSNLRQEFDPLYGNRWKYITRVCTEINVHGLCTNFKRKMLRSLLKKIIDYFQQPL